MTASTSAQTETPAPNTTPSQPPVNPLRHSASRKQGKPTATAAVAPKKHHGPGLRSGTKTAKILRLLARPNGASLAELTKATGWQTHSVRGFLSGAIKRKMRLKLASLKRPDGVRAYHLKSK